MICNVLSRNDGGGDDDDGLCLFTVHELDSDLDSILDHCRAVQSGSSTMLKAMNLSSVSNRDDRLIITRLIVKEYTNQYQQYKFRSA